MLKTLPSQYPLIVTGKQVRLYCMHLHHLLRNLASDKTRWIFLQSKVTLRSRYCEYWMHLTGLLHKAERSGHDKIDGFIALESIIKTLIKFSSLGTVNIRLAVTEASLTIGRGLIEAKVALRKELETSERQINAEQSQQKRTGSSGGAGGSRALVGTSLREKSARLLALEAQRDSFVQVSQDRCTGAQAAYDAFLRSQIMAFFLHLFAILFVMVLRFQHCDDINVVHS